jgi:hypothetical protein
VSKKFLYVRGPGGRPATALVSPANDLRAVILTGPDTGKIISLAGRQLNPVPMPQLSEKEDGFEVIREAWMKEARKMEIARLEAFMDRLLTAYQHDYGTAVHACTACTLAAAWAASRQQGISGFQASHVGLRFLAEWNVLKGPFKIVDYMQALYPQYLDRLGPQRLDPSTAVWLRSEASKLLADDARDAHPDVRSHWELLAAGGMPAGWSIKVDEDAPPAGGDDQ